MNKLVYKHIVLIIFLLIGSYTVFSQDADKVIIDGKTYYLHIVQKGEGFYGIAKKYGVSQKEIHDANPKSIFGLKPGDVLHIPVIKGRNNDSSQIEDSNEFVYHTIEKGQTLYFLSRKYNVTIEDIKKYNVGADQNLIIGSIFKIPVNKNVDNRIKNTYVFHKVEPKETLYGISRKYDVAIQEIIKSNPALQNGILEIGSTIRIPKSAFAKNETETVEKTQKLEDEQYIYHRVQAGDTFYSISNKYNITKEAVYNANPDLNPDDLALGYLVRIPKAEISREEQRISQNDDFKVHIVKRKETVYSIANKYNINVEDIEMANPTLILTNIKKGTKLIIPSPEYIARIKQEEVTEKQDLTQERVVRNMDSIFVDCGSYDYNTLKETISVAVMLPFDVEATKKANIITKIVDDEEVEVDRDEPILSSRSRTFVEFYEGMLLALDSIKKQGVNVQVFTYDTAPDTNKVKQILAQPELKSVDFIIGPAFTSNLKLVSDFSYEHGIKLIYPLSNKNPEIKRNPYLIQVNTPDSLMYDKYVSYIVNKSQGSRILVLKSKEPESLENQFCSALKDKLYMDYIPKGLSPNYMEVSFSQQDVQAIDALLDSEIPNLVVIPSPKEADISKILTTLHGVVELSSDKQVKLIGFGDWLKYQTINAEEIHDLNTDILTSYALDYDDTVTNEFLTKYRSWFNTEPFAVAPYFIRPGKNSKFSKYGIWGFDVTYYFMSARVKYGKEFEYCLPDFKSKQVQFNFDFERIENWGGIYNRGLCVLTFNSDLKVLRKKL
ncbi:LysM peptidoglycan-binding domain-containing protein [Plebeiibacterium sediminum]|uniref:LysM peptidoglycan-binding domain-containing protein n=1 Tax=Plebeiibacterium sediminum TaxID=2992112 RepID=A0AAE3SDZ6_9BACT|nr:LysM peptidoglycan-binding domain-containing protein [Plebeiobacterium sediminum]MCW3785447.1 LysM peptidoglycan-binding domain-containing protein [Plebeiobacterium sediminum]